MDLKNDVDSVRRGWKEFLLSLKEMDPGRRAIAFGLIGGGLIVILVISFLLMGGMDAKVIFVPSSGPEMEPFVLVTNTGRSTWKNVMLTLNGAYTLKLERVEPNQDVRAFVSTFLAPKGTVPKKLVITCNRGTYVQEN